MPDQAAAGLEEPLLQARQGPSLDGDGQNQPTWPRLEVVGDHSEGSVGRLWVKLSSACYRYTSAQAAEAEFQVAQCEVAAVPKNDLRAVARTS